MESPKKVVVGLGEVLWDVFPTGPRFGGARANFACSVASLSSGDSQVYMVSGVGNDDLGQQALQTLRQHGVDTSCVLRLSEPTGQVDIELNESGNASYEFAADTAWDNLTWNGRLRQLAWQADAVCFGTLAQRSPTSRETIQQFVATTAADCLRVFDINLRPPFYEFGSIEDSLRLANVLKLNEDELVILAKQLGLAGDEVCLLKALTAKYELKCVALTLGSKGSMLVRGDETSHMTVGEETNVIDTVGAGDAFTATLTLGLLAGKELEQIHRQASKVAAFVCSQPGATPEFPSELRM